jgi:hypothetical protein
VARRTCTVAAGLGPSARAFCHLLASRRDPAPRTPRSTTAADHHRVPPLSKGQPRLQDYTAPPLGLRGGWGRRKHAVAQLQQQDAPHGVVNALLADCAALDGIRKLLQRSLGLV